MAPIDDGTYTAVIDRFENEQAVLLVEADQTQIGELVVDQEALPEDGQHVDVVLTVEIQNGELTECQYDQAATDKRTEQAQNRFNRLSERLSPPDDEDTIE